MWAYSRPLQAGLDRDRAIILLNAYQTPSTPTVRRSGHFRRYPSLRGHPVAYVSADDASAGPSPQLGRIPDGVDVANRPRRRGWEVSARLETDALPSSRIADWIRPCAGVAAPPTTRRCSTTGPPTAAANRSSAPASRLLATAPPTPMQPTGPRATASAAALSSAPSQREWPAEESGLGLWKWPCLTPGPLLFPTPAG